MILLETRAGARLSHGGRAILPLARSLRLSLPGDVARLLWSRPLAVVVEEGAESRLVRVPDWTRRIQWLLWGTGLFAAFLLRRFPNRRERRRRIFRR